MVVVAKSHSLIDYLIGDGHAWQRKTDQVESVDQVFAHATGESRNVVIAELKW